MRFLVIRGDFFDKSPLWQNYRANAETYLDAVRKPGGIVDLIDLPAMDITGDTNMFA